MRTRCYVIERWFGDVPHFVVEKIDTQSRALLKYELFQATVASFLAPEIFEELAVSLVKIIVITIIVLLSILLFGRFFV
jgi:hypothetical protein